LAHGDAVKILSESSDRVKPTCNHAYPDGCGGCDFQHIEISAQKDLKLEVIRDQFMRIAKIEVDPEMLSAKPIDGLHWRTRFDFAVSDNGKAGLFSSKTKKSC
jgi:tRNA/tmRNA/rRNA uracil-C5-methylase (TrmA/RlmC/RlmD family)